MYHIYRTLFSPSPIHMYGMYHMYHTYYMYRVAPDIGNASSRTRSCEEQLNRSKRLEISLSINNEDEIFRRRVDDITKRLPSSPTLMLHRCGVVLISYIALCSCHVACPAALTDRGKPIELRNGFN